MLGKTLSPYTTILFGHKDNNLFIINLLNITNASIKSAQRGIMAMIKEVDIYHMRLVTKIFRGTCV